MDFLLAMSVFTSTGDIARENAKVQEWMKAWVARDVHNRGAAAEQGGPQQRLQKERRAQQARAPPHEKRLQGMPRLAPEFDGLNCFETIVYH